jgi:hypothetical protein
MKRHAAIVFSMCALLLASMAGAGYCRTWHLNPGGTGDAPSVQAAFDSVSAGDTILFSQGSYIQHALCDSVQGLTLLSEGGPGSAVFQAEAGHGIMAFAWCTHIKIDGLAFLDSDAGIGFYSCSYVDIQKTSFKNVGTAYANGSAIAFQRCDDITIENSTIAASYLGLAFDEVNSGISIRGNTFVGSSLAGVSFNTSFGVTIENNLVCGGYYGLEGVPLAPTITCNDVFGNTSNYALMGVPDPTGTNGNISVDPQFCAADPIQSRNYFLQSDSPCAPGNHPQGYSCGLIGAFSVGCSTVSIERKTWSGIKAMYR